MVEASKNTAAAGRLDRLEKGRFFGEITLAEGADTLPEVTIEVLAHGIALTHHRVIPRAGASAHPVEFALSGFPDVALPCALRARIVETDVTLDCPIELKNLEDVWQRMMPFQVSIEEIRYNALVLQLDGDLTNPPDFDLFDWGEPVDANVSDAAFIPATGARQLINLPKSMLDGREHRLTIVHRQSGLPVHSKPIALRFAAQLEAQVAIADVIARVDRLERDLRQRFGEAFNAVAAPLYRHIDAVTLNQRSNFEREVAAMRQLLGLPAKEPTAPPPSEILLPFKDEVLGYGIHPVEISPTGKAFRNVAPSCGILLSGLVPAPSYRIRVQGLRRRSDADLEGVVLIVNGRVAKTKLYRDPNSGSWNLSGMLSAQEIRQERNLIELRLPNSKPKVDDPPELADMPVGILHIEIAAVPAPSSARDQGAAAG